MRSVGGLFPCVQRSLQPRIARSGPRLVLMEANWGDFDLRHEKQWHKTLIIPPNLNLVPARALEFLVGCCSRATGSAWLRRCRSCETSWSQPHERVV